MNFGINHIARKISTEMYQSPWSPLEAFPTGKTYSIQHPFGRSPIAAYTMYRCKKPEQIYTPGMVIQEASIKYGRGWEVVMQSYSILVCARAAIFFRQSNANLSFVPATGFWEIGWLIIA